MAQEKKFAPKLTIIPNFNFMMIHFLKKIYKHKKVIKMRAKIIFNCIST